MLEVEAHVLVPVESTDLVLGGIIALIQGELPTLQAPMQAGCSS